MADTILNGAMPPGTTADETLPRRTFYDCGGGRKTFFSLAFILLLPFFISTPVMIYQRVAKGVWLDTWGLIVIAVVFAVLMLLILFELMFSLRAYVDIGTDAVSFTLPVRGGGVVPLFFYSARRIPYDEITAVETRREVFKSMVAPMMMRTVRLNLRTGERLLLGYTNEADDDPKFPFPQIGRQIADRAGVPFVDRGNVLTELHKRMFGVADATRESEESEIAQLNRQHNRFLVTLIAALGVLLAAGIANDIWQENIDAGEQARTEVQQRGPAKRR
ncbi:MAG: hypothetical protein KDJ36_10760 [Hyphomicrobiaceae bacterium]|nr:hypothetical protein [Hyphomicrobiaceae bacterium]